jgi:peptide deformylase
MAKILGVAQLGQEILRKQAQVVKQVSDEKVQLLISNMLETVMDVDGLGLAAPQVYEDMRIFIMASHSNSRYPNAPEMEPIAIINPEIIEQSEEIVKDWEGCLSIPGIRGFVPRPESVKVRFTTGAGEVKEEEFSGLPARIFQHEYDHLEGVVFLDRLESNKEIITDKEYLRMINAKNGKIKK